jgi:hypothetical protein
MSVTFTSAAGSPTLNVANGNAAELFELLGLEFDGDYGEATAEDFLGRVLIAQALVGVAFDDENGRPTFSEGLETWCGRRPGYLAEKLAILHRIATWAVEHKAMVWWS